MVFRVLVGLLLDTSGWLAPDLPLAVLGLMFLDLRVGGWRWPLAAAAVTALQLLASATGISSVPPTAVATAAIATTLAILIAVILGLARHRAARTGAAAAALAILLVTLTPSPPAQAHDPGQGPSFGTAEMTVTGDGEGHLVVTIARVSTDQPGELVPTRLVARRAGQSVDAPLRDDGATATGQITLPSAGLWFVYARLQEGARPLEVWVPVDQQLATSRTSPRSIYEPVPAGGGGAAQLLLGTLLLAGGAALTVAAVLTVHRRRPARQQDVGPPTATE